MLQHQIRHSSDIQKYSNLHKVEPNTVVYMGHGTRKHFDINNKHHSEKVNSPQMQRLRQEWRSISGPRSWLKCGTSRVSLLHGCKMLTSPVMWPPRVNKCSGITDNLNSASDLKACPHRRLLQSRMRLCGQATTLLFCHRSRILLNQLDHFYATLLPIREAMHVLSSFKVLTSTINLLFVRIATITWKAAAGFFTEIGQRTQVRSTQPCIPPGR